MSRRYPVNAVGRPSGYSGFRRVGRQPCNSRVFAVIFDALFERRAHGFEIFI